jgi:hypothetical protein
MRRASRRGEVTGEKRMNVGTRSARRAAALLAAGVLVAVSSAAAAGPVAAASGSCTTVSMVATGVLQVGIEATDCGSLGDPAYLVTAELFERRTLGRTSYWGYAGGGIDLVDDASVKVPVGGWYDLVVTSESDAGGVVVQEASALVDDGDLVTIDQPVLGFRPGSMTSGAYPAAVRWSRVGSEPAKRYAVQRSLDGGAFAPFGTTRTTSIDAVLKPGHFYTFRVRGINDDGDPGPWRSTGPARPAGYPDGSGALDYDGSWRVATNNAYWGNRAHVTGTAGRSVTLDFWGGGAAVVAAIGPNRGSFRVYVDGVYRRTVKTVASSMAYRRVVYAVQWAQPGEHRVRLVVVGTAGHPRVDLDGILVLRGVK